jgi:hypothetical protein
MFVETASLLSPLFLFDDGLGIGFSIRVEELLAALGPRRSHLRCGDVPIRPAFSGDDAKVLAEVFDSRPAQNQ